MNYLYIDLKTKLESNSVRTILNHNGKRYQLIDPETGDSIITLPDNVDPKAYNKIIYEDDAIKIRT
jgi:hypothetical protein